MTNSEIKSWAKNKLKGHLWEVLIPLVVTSILTNLTIGASYTIGEEGQVVSNNGYNLGFFFFFVAVGFAAYMIKFINDEPHEFKDLFAYAKDYIRIFLVGLLRGLFIFLWALLFIIPGIIKAFGYALVPMLLADEKYNNLGYRALLKKSEEMMNGHKMDYFLLGLSYIGWILLAICTFGILFIWVSPYMSTAFMKFLYEVKTNYEKANGTAPAEEKPAEEKTEVLEDKASSKFCTNCGSELPEGSGFCTNCGQEVK